MTAAFEPSRPVILGSRIYPFVTLAVALATGIFTFTAAAGLMGSWRVALAVAAIVAALVFVAARRRPFIALDDEACPRGLRIVSAIAAIGALIQLGRLAIFIVSPAQVGFSTFPRSAFETRHSCLTAYYVAAQAADTTPNFYDNALYSRADDDPRARRRPLTLGAFNVDVFEYPPPFLLVPRAMRLATPDFLDLRMLWFGLSGATLLVATIVVARWLGPQAGSRALLLSPLIWLAPPTLNTLQKGNVQPLVIALVVIAMALFERRRYIAGGAVLAYTTVGKLFPGLMLVYLLARREWRAFGWTAAFGVVFAVLTVADIGLAPFASFMDHMPGLLSGEAFPAFRNPAAIAINYSVPGLVFKANLFGWTDLGFGAAKIVGWIYTLVALGATVFVARHVRDEQQRPLAWLTVLILATLRSPFLPQAYAPIPALWLVTVFAAIQRPTTRVLSLTVLAALVLAFMVPVDSPIDARLLAIISLVPQATMIAVTVFVLMSLRSLRVQRQEVVAGLSRAG